MPTLDEAKKEPLADDIVTRAAGKTGHFRRLRLSELSSNRQATLTDSRAGARGTDLTMLGKRIRQSWFDRGYATLFASCRAWRCLRSNCRAWCLGQRHQSPDRCRVGDAQHSEFSRPPLPRARRAQTQLARTE